jgi:hypothetical protein
MYCCLTEVPECYAPGNGDMLTLSWTSAFWVHNYVANQAYNRYSQMIPDIRRVQNGLEDAMAEGVKKIEAEVASMKPAARRKALSEFSKECATNSTTKFKELGDYLLVKYLDGNIKAETEPGVFARTATGYCASPKWGGYDDPRYYRAIVEENGDHFKVVEPKTSK